MLLRSVAVEPPPMTIPRQKSLNWHHRFLVVHGELLVVDNGGGDPR
jgi:hypothetical protein